MKKTMMMIGLAAMMCGTSGCFFTASCKNVWAYPVGMVLDVLTSPIQVPEDVDYLTWLSYEQIFGFQRRCKRREQSCLDALRRNALIMFEEPKYFCERDEKGYPTAEFAALKGYIRSAGIETIEKIPSEKADQIVAFVMTHPEHFEMFGPIWRKKTIGEQQRLDAIKLIRRYPGAEYGRETLEALVDHPSLGSEVLRRTMAEQPLDDVSWMAEQILSAREKAKNRTKMSGGAE